MAKARQRGRPPTPLSRELVQYVVGFSVAFVVGLAPYLGAVEVPGFRALLTLFPISIRDTMIPASAALMGIVAVTVQWYGSDKADRKWLARSFTRTLVIALVSLVTLVVIHSFSVVRVSLDGGKHAVSFVVSFVRSSSCGCSLQLSDADCIKNISLDEAAIDSCWGDKMVAINRILLILLYLAVTGSFVWLVGVLLLRMQLKP
jgi:hypothetical protein